MPGSKKFHRAQSGAVLAEAAIIIPLILGLLFFIIEFGNVFYLTNTLNQISRTAVRYASVTSSYTTGDLITQSMAGSLIPDIARFTLAIDPAPTSPRNVGTTITVSVQYNYLPIINPFGFFNSNQEWMPVLRASSVARSEVSYAG